MPRRPRIAPAGLVYHVLNRAAGRLRLFKTEKDYLAFEHLLRQAHQRHPIRILDWCLMPNHWHFVVYPDKEGQLTAFFRWLAHTHAMRHHVAKGMVGMGPLYQGRFKAFAVQEDEHLLMLLRYVQRNPVRAKLTESAPQWRWGSAAVRLKGPPEMRELLSPWPVDPPSDWRKWVDRPLNEQDQRQIQLALRRSRPLGDAHWTQQIAAKLDLLYTLHPRGRPRKEKHDKELRPL